MKRRKFFGIGAVGLFGAATCSLWDRGPTAVVPALTLVSAQSSEYVAAERESELMAVLKVVVDEGPADDRPPVHVGLVIDASASMGGAPIGAARAAAAELIEALHEGDRLTVVTFHSRADLVVENVEIDDDTREESLEKVAAIEARGTTDLAAGLSTALQDLSPHVSQGRVTRVVLLSDGVPNDASTIPYAVDQANGMGVTITALGFGLDYDETLLASIAQQTGGTFHFLAEPEDLVPVFRAENLRLSGIAAQNITLSLTTGPNVDLLEVVGQSFALPQPSLDLGLGDLSRGEERTVVVRLRVGAHRDGATVELLDGRLSYSDPKTGEYVECDVFLSAHAEADEARLAVAMDPAVESEIKNAEVAAITLSAVSMARQGQGASAYRMLQSAAPVAAESAARLDDSRLQEQVEYMNELSSTLEDEEDELPPEESIQDGTVGDLVNAPTAGKRAQPRSSKSKLTIRKAHNNAVDNLQTRGSAISLSGRK